MGKLYFTSLKSREGEVLSFAVKKQYGVMLETSVHLC